MILGDHFKKAPSGYLIGALNFESYLLYPFLKFNFTVTKWVNRLFIDIHV